jgi:hypothetical protein
VIVPAYNAEDTIEECVSSLLALRYPQARREFIPYNPGPVSGLHARIGTGSYPRIGRVCSGRPPRPPGAAPGGR